MSSLELHSLQLSTHPLTQYYILYEIDRNWQKVDSFLKKCVTKQIDDGGLSNCWWWWWSDSQTSLLLILVHWLTWPNTEHMILILIFSTKLISKPLIKRVVKQTQPTVRFVIGPILQFCIPTYNIYNIYCTLHSTALHCIQCTTCPIDVSVCLKPFQIVKHNMRSWLHP